VTDDIHQVLLNVFLIVLNVADNVIEYLRVVFWRPNMLPSLCSASILRNCKFSIKCR